MLSQACAGSGPAPALHLLAAVLSSRGHFGATSQSLARCWGSNCRQATGHMQSAPAGCAPPGAGASAPAVATSLLPAACAAQTAPLNPASAPGGLLSLLAWARALAPHGGRRAYATGAGPNPQDSQNSSGNSSSSDSSSSSSSNAGGSSELLANKSRVLQFSQDRGEAERQWEAHHAGLLSSHPGGWDSCKATLLPWWSFAAQADVYVSSAQVGSCARVCVHVCVRR